MRGAVAGVQFDDFHKNSAKIIRSSVFGIDATSGKVRDRFSFPSNKLCITSIDIQALPRSLHAAHSALQSAEPVDQRTRDALQKSVQLAIEITTNSQEATARHEAQVPRCLSSLRRCSRAAASRAGGQGPAGAPEDRG